MTQFNRYTEKGMLKEVPDCRQITGEPSRRWFTDGEFDLIVWYQAGDKIIGFQLCYNKKKSERAITWMLEKGYSHNKVDTGEMYGYKTDSFTPVLVADGVFDVRKVTGQFKHISQNIDTAIVEFVLSKLEEYPSNG